MDKFDSSENISSSTPKKSAPKEVIVFNDSGIDGHSSNDSGITGQLELSGFADSKKALKLDDDSPVSTRKVKIQVFVDIPEVSKFGEIWRRHSFNIMAVIITAILQIYSIIAIAISGFKKVQPLFGLTMFLWFCLIYMFIREHLGSAIHRSCIKPCVSVVNSQWKWLGSIGVQLGGLGPMAPHRVPDMAVKMYCMKPLFHWEHCCYMKVIKFSKMPSCTCSLLCLSPDKHDFTPPSL